MKTKLAMDDCLMGAESYRDILFSRKDPTREFILNGCTYEGIYRLAEGIRRLHPASGKSHATICLCTDDKTLMAAAIVAALAGGPHLVLPYAFSPQVVEEVMEILPLSFLLTDAPGDFPSGPEVITPHMLHRDYIIPDTFRGPDEPFLTLFTGGSTGKSKAWSKTPRNMLAEALYLSKKFSISADDIFLSTVPPRHIYGLLYSVLIPFVSSARVLDGVYTFPREILRAAEDYRASVLVSVPLHYRVLKVDDLQRHNLRIAFSTTAVLDKDDAVYFHNKTGVDITEIYGSTETGGVATKFCLRDDESWQPLEPVDWKIQGGVLHVRSAFVSPTLPLDENGFFATADRADPYEARRFILRGRADDIVKIGGKRVDLAAVQNKLKQMPGVRDAVVISIPNGKGRQNELAAVVATHLGALQVRRHIAAISEAYAVPKRIAVVEEIPMMHTGKYDRTRIERLFRA